jgi:UDP-N-acetylglucosamine--N-acetylmuramyl-(pentapeptide) pyrophosphoryl-undecaprenol N-acetylglucosamine transferase
VLHASDALPGRVIRWCAPWAELVSVYFAETKGLKGVPVQMPIRGLEMPSETVAEVRKQLGLDAKKQTVLVCGGSQGAQALNERVPHGLVRCGVQVIHLVGKADRVAAVEQIYREGGVKALVLPFEERMGRVYKAADLAICRAGANTCAELIACGLPAVLIPFPAAMDKHQDANAAVLADQVGGAIALDQQQLTADWIASNIPQLPLEQMRLRLENYRMGMQRPSLDQLIMEML